MRIRQQLGNNVFPITFKKLMSTPKCCLDGQEDLFISFNLLNSNLKTNIQKYIYMNALDQCAYVVRSAQEKKRSMSRLKIISSVP